MAKSVEFRVLGPVRALVAGRPADLGERKQRLILGMLALEVNKVVPVCRLEEMLWGGSPPRSARRIIQAHISRLRAALGAVGATSDGTALIRHGSGYLLAVDPGSVDVNRFRFLVEEAKLSPDALGTVRALRAALALWQGPALADAAPDDVRQRLCGGLEEMRLMTVEKLLDAMLRLGQHMEIIEELTDLTAQHPYRPRLTQLLMLALYRAGRTADALSTFQALRDGLRREMGLDPPDELVELHVAILRGDPGLSPVQVRDAHPSPAQLPGDIGDFTGRAADLTALSRLVSRRGPDCAGPAIIAITGGAGVGKTAFAVHWASLMSGEFPDGQLYVNLQGYSATAPVTPLDALTALLHGIGVPTARIPADEQLAAAMYRSEMSTRRMIVVLDNARSSEHVRVLLPGRSRSATLITSRAVLSGLIAREGAARISLRPLSESEAVTLLAGMIGMDRIRDEAVAAAALAGQCGYLPLALRIAAARLLAVQDASIADYVKELAEEEDGLAALQIDDDESTSIWAAFDHSYLALDPSTRRTFRLLSLLGSGSLPVPVIAAMNDVAVGQTKRTLERLAGAHLVERHSGARFGLHDLLLRYATVKSKIEDPIAERHAALLRLIRWYLGSAGRAVRLYSPFAERCVPPPAAEDPDPDFADTDDAVAWLEVELPHMVAAVVRAAADGDGEILLLAAQLARELHSFLYRRGHLSSDILISEAALAAATRGRNIEAEAWACIALGAVRHLQGQDCQALTWLDRATGIAREVGDSILLATCLSNTLDIWWKRGEVSKCEAALHEELALRLSLGDRHHAAFCWLNLGEVHREQGLYQKSRACYEDSLSALREVGDRYGEALVLHGLACLHVRMEQFDTAIRLLCEATTLLKVIANRSALACMLADLGRAHRLRGAHEEAMSCLYEGLRLCRDLGMRRQEVEYLRELSIALGEIVPEQAESYRRQSLAILGELRTASGV